MSALQACTLECGSVGRPAFPACREDDRTVTRNRYHEDFRTFAEAVMRFFKTTLPDKWHEIRNTVTDNFQIIRPEKFRVIG